MDAEQTSYPPVRELTKGQRRVLGVLLEKAFTTPESYPLTLKAATTACNQKSNREPVTNYSEDAVLEYLDELRARGLVGVVHTESGRTERYRHYMRKRFDFTEPQLAVLTELLLRGRQQMGELRARASRMVPIDSLDVLRDELTGLQQQGYVQSTGPLERRGVEVDHGFYPAAEGHRLEPATPPDEDVPPALLRVRAPQPPIAGASYPTEPADDRLPRLAHDVGQLQQKFEQLQGAVSDLRDQLDHLKRSLGVM